MIMHLVPTKDDAIWFGVGYVAARAYAVDDENHIPFHGPARVDWMVRSYTDGVRAGLLVRNGKSVTPLFENEDTRIAIVLVTAGLLKPHDLAMLIERWCANQGFKPFTHTDGRLAALNAAIEADKARMESENPGIPEPLLRALKLVEENTGVKAKIVKVTPEQAEALESGEEIDPDELLDPSKKKPILN